MSSELSKDERKRIAEAFRDVSGGRLTKAQKRVLEDYDISVGHTGKGRPCFVYGGASRPFTLNPSDRRAGRNIATKLMEFIVENYTLRQLESSR